MALCLINYEISYEYIVLQGISWSVQNRRAHSSGSKNVQIYQLGFIISFWPDGTIKIDTGSPVHQFILWEHE